MFSVSQKIFIARQLNRTLRLVRHDDIADFEALGIPKLNRLLHLLVRGSI